MSHEMSLFLGVRSVDCVAESRKDSKVPRVVEIAGCDRR